jgi:hypothetical protein
MFIFLSHTNKIIFGYDQVQSPPCFHLIPASFIEIMAYVGTQHLMTIPFVA